VTDWLDDFVKYASYGEASPRLMYWVGVSTIAGALRRKVWIDQEIFQWSPNFYILVVGEPGSVRKSTSIDLGIKRFLEKVEGINLGPSSVTWQALIEHIASLKEEVTLPDGEVFTMSPVTLSLSEFGTFFDPTNRELVDNLTDLWDGKLGKIDKMTKTSGCDQMVNSWINIIAATTPKWLSQNFGDALVGGGLAGRFIYLFENMPTRDIAYPKRGMPPRALLRKTEAALLDRLKVMANYGGEIELTEEAYEWGDEWYKGERKKLRGLGSGSLESGFIVRKQVHLHKLAMVISAARCEFPSITLTHMLAAQQQLDALDADMKNVFGYVGQSKVTTAAREIVEAVKALGSVERRVLYQRQFFRTMTITEYNEAVQSAIHAELVMEQDGVARAILMPR
jgi:hypothetical protein